MNPKENNLDADIAKGKEDILRARKAKQQTPKPAPSSEEKVQDPTELMRAVVDANKKKHEQRDSSNVPRFDVAERVLAEQRRSTAARRSGPGKVPIVEIPAKPLDRIDIIPRTTPKRSSLIVEIVARDIQKLINQKYE